MERLTKYKSTPNSMFPYKLIDDGANTELDVIHKLGQIEDIEEDLGIDLITLFKALQYGIYGKSGNIVYPYNVLLVEKKLHAYPLDIWDESWDLVDYGKTWALTKEELI